MASALLSYMLISGIFGRRNLDELSVELEIPQEIFAQTDTLIGIRLANKRKFMPAFLISVLVADRWTLFPFIDSASEEKQFCRLRFVRRGQHLITGVCISSVFPFNFFSRYRKIEQNLKLVVLPRPERCETMRLHDRQTRLKGEASALSLGYDADIVSIRDYVLGDPLKYISWKSTAKTGVLKTKELSSLELQQVMIDFDKMEGRDMEHKISCVTYLILKFIRSNIPVGLVIDGEKLSPAVSASHKTRLLRKLALYGQN